MSVSSAIYLYLCPPQQYFYLSVHLSNLFIYCTCPVSTSAIYLFICPLQQSIYLSDYLSTSAIYLFICLLRQSTLTIYLHFSLSVHFSNLSIFLSICLPQQSIYLSVYTNISMLGSQATHVPPLPLFATV